MEKVTSETIASNRICTFCCKVVKASAYDSVAKQQHVEKLEQFLTNLERYLEIRTNSLKLFRQELENNNVSACRYIVCANCESVLTEFCDIYHQIKTLELKAQWKVDTLLSIMKQANRVPCRTKILKQILENTDKYENLAITRKRFIKTCKYSGRKICIYSQKQYISLIF